MPGSRGRPGSLFESAEEYRQAGQHREAIVQYRNALHIVADVPALLGLAKSFQALGSHDLAFAFLRRILEIDENQIDAQLALGRYALVAARRDSSRFKEVREIAENILSQSPDTEEAQILLADALAGEGDPAAATRTLEQALAHHPRSLELAMALGRAYAGTGQVPRAENLFRELAKQQPDSAQPLLALGNLLATDRPQEAEEVLRNAFRDFAQESGVVAALVGFYLSHGRVEDAESFLR